MTNDDYKPVSCAMHSELELAIMHKQVMELCWQNESGEMRTENVVPVDIITSNHAEFLVVKTDNNQSVSIRLDQIKDQ